MRTKRKGAMRLMLGEIIMSIKANRNHKGGNSNILVSFVGMITMLMSALVLLKSNK